MSDAESEFGIQDCPCKDPRCKSVLFVMYRPILKEAGNTGELAAVVHFSLEYVDQMINELKRWKQKKALR